MRTNEHEAPRRDPPQDSEATEAPERTWPWYRSPWFWGFTIGLVFLTALRPFLVWKPEPLPRLGSASVSASLWDVRGDETALDARIGGEVALVGIDCAEGQEGCVRTSAVMRKLWMVHEIVGDPPVQMIVMVSDAEEPKDLRRLRIQRDVDHPSWLHVGGDVVAVSSHLERVAASSAFPGGVQAGFDLNGGWLALVDGSGEVRGFYAAQRLDVVNELYHRVRQLRGEP